MNEYSTDAIQVLSAVEHVRKRPGMYVGDTESPCGAEHVVNELVANTLDLFLAGEALNVEVTVAGDRITIEDDGPGESSPTKRFAKRSGNASKSP